MTPGRFIIRIHYLLCCIILCPSEQGLGVVVPSTLCPEEVPEGMRMLSKERTSLKKLFLFFVSLHHPICPLTVGKGKHQHLLLLSLAMIMREFRGIINIINSNQWRMAGIHHFRRGRGGRLGLARCPAPGSRSLLPDAHSLFSSQQSREMAEEHGSMADAFSPQITTLAVLWALGVGLLLQSTRMRVDKEQGCSHNTEHLSIPLRFSAWRTGCSKVFPHPEGNALPRTCADHPSILVVAAVMDAPAQAVAGRQEGLAAVAVDVVQEDTSCSIAKIGIAFVIQGLPTAQLLADHAGIAQAPVIIAHGAPVPTVEDLHPALAGVGAAHQADAAVTWRVAARGEKDVVPIPARGTAMPP